MNRKKTGWILIGTAYFIALISLNSYRLCFDSCSYNMLILPIGFGIVLKTTGAYMIVK